MAAVRAGPWLPPSDPLLSQMIVCLYPVLAAALSNGLAQARALSAVHADILAALGIPVHKRVKAVVSPHHGLGVRVYDGSSQPAFHGHGKECGIDVFPLGQSEGYVGYPQHGSHSQLVPMRRRVSRVVRAPLLSELTVMQSPSRMISSGPIPYSAARSMIFLPTARRPSAVSGMPDSSRQRPTATPPYFAISGNTRLMDSSLPLTELISGFPLYIRMARSMASMSDVSI